MKGKQVGNAKLWILIAVLAAAAAAVLVFSDDFPPGEQNVSGTIVPAERFGSSQISSEDVVLGADSNAGSGSPQAAEGLMADAASNAVVAARANDSNAVVAARGNDSNAVVAARGNDSNAVVAARSNDSNAANAARANDSNAANAARANDGRN